MKMTEQTDDSASLLFWGPPFSGKSVLASQFPNPHFISLDAHTLTSVRGLRARYKLDFDVNIIDITEEPTTDPEFAKITGNEKYAKEPAWQKTKRLLDGWASILTKDDTLILDNLSRASEYLLAFIRKSAGREQLQIQDWGVFVAEIEKLTEVINHHARKCNVIVIGHEEIHTDELTKQLKRYLLMPTKARNRIPSVSTDYLYMTTEMVIEAGKRVPVRMLKSIPTHDAQTGSRILIPDLKFPTYTKMKPYLNVALGRELPEANWTPTKDE